MKRDQEILESIRTRLLKISVRSRSSKQQVSSPDHQQTYLYLDQSKAGWHNRHGADLDLLTPGKTNRLLESETFPGKELDVIPSWLHSDLLKDGEALDLEVWTPFPVSVDRQLGMLATGLMKTVVVSFPCTRGSRIALRFLRLFLTQLIKKINHLSDLLSLSLSLSLSVSLSLFISFSFSHLLPIAQDILPLKSTLSPIPPPRSLSLSPPLNQQLHVID